MAVVTTHKASSYILKLPSKGFDHIKHAEEKTTLQNLKVLGNLSKCEVKRKGIKTLKK